MLERDLQLYKNEILTRVFSFEIFKIFKTSFFTEHFLWLLLFTFPYLAYLLMLIYTYLSILKFSLYYYYINLIGLIKYGEIFYIEEYF